MTSAAKRRPRPLMWSAMLACGLLTACNFPSENGVAVGSKGLWIANGANVVEYIPGQFVSGASSAAPHRVINSTAFGTPQAVTFDLNGNMWVLDPSGNVNGAATPAMLEFSAAQLAALGTNSAPAPVATITSANLTSPRGAVIDSSGNAWVTDHNSNTVLVFGQSQLGQTGDHFFGPVLIITSGDFKGPSGIAFNGAGDLWVSNNGNVPASGGATGPAGTTVVGVSAAHVPAVPANSRAMPDIPADVTLSDDGTSSIQAPWALAFDSLGNLWSSNANSSTVVEFAKASVAASGAPAPSVILSSTSVTGNPSLNAPKGICFDDVGNLAAIDSAGAFGAAFFGEKQLKTGSPTPDTFLAGAGTTLNSPVGCAYGPLAN
jgi:hypothetical protein